MGQRLQTCHSFLIYVTNSGVQYLLDRVGQSDVPMEGSRCSNDLLSLIEKYWYRFPPPSQGLTIYFVPKIHPKVTTPGECQCELCKFRGRPDADLEADNLPSSVVGNDFWTTRSRLNSSYSRRLCMEPCLSNFPETRFGLNGGHGSFRSIAEAFVLQSFANIFTRFFK